MRRLNPPMDNKKLALFINSLGGGGAEGVRVNLANSLRVIPPKNDRGDKWNFVP